MLTRQELADPQSVLGETLRHFGVAATDETFHLWDDLTALKELNPCLALADFTKKFRVVIDYDPEYKTALIRIL